MNSRITKTIESEEFLDWAESHKNLTVEELGNICEIAESQIPPQFYDFSPADIKFRIAMKRKIFWARKKLSDLVFEFQAQSFSVGKQ
jgi:hypothetical protein